MPLTRSFVIPGLVLQDEHTPEDEARRRGHDGVAYWLFSVRADASLGVAACRHTHLCLCACKCCGLHTLAHALDMLVQASRDASSKAKQTAARARREDNFQSQLDALGSAGRATSANFLAVGTSLAAVEFAAPDKWM